MTWGGDEVHRAALLANGTDSDAGTGWQVSGGIRAEQAARGEDLAADVVELAVPVEDVAEPHPRPGDIVEGAADLSQQILRLLEHHPRLTPRGVGLVRLKVATDQIVQRSLRSRRRQGRPATDSTVGLPRPATA